MKRYFLTALCLLSVLPGTAAADMIDGNAPAKWVEVSQKLAEKTFPSSPCRGRYIIHTNADNAPEIATHSDMSGLYVGYCTFYVRKQTDPIEFCRVYLHEYGHGALTGTDEDHKNPVAGGIMSKFVQYKPCADAWYLAKYGRLPKMVRYFPKKKALAAVYKKYPAQKWRAGCEPIVTSDSQDKPYRDFGCTVVGRTVHHRKQLLVSWDPFKRKIVVKNDPI